MVCYMDLLRVASQHDMRIQMETDSHVHMLRHEIHFGSLHARQFL